MLKISPLNHFAFYRNIGKNVGAVQTAPIGSKPENLGKKPVKN